MADDACSAVKSDLESGTYTNYTNSFPIYIENEDPFEGGYVYILLRDPNREPVQSVSGNVIFTKRSCMLIIVANSTTNRDNLYKDVVDILTATSRGYKLIRGRDPASNQEYFSLKLQVSMLL